MGCCFSGEDDTDNQRAASERDPLLGGSSAPIANGQRPVDDIHNSSTGPISKTDEQSLLSRILHQTAQGENQSVLKQRRRPTNATNTQNQVENAELPPTGGNNVIDVSATEPHSIERTEYMERSRQYMSKLSSVNNSAPYNNADLPAGVKSPQVVLASDPIPAGDIAFVIHAAKGAESSLSAFHVKAREALVVQFESS